MTIVSGHNESQGRLPTGSVSVWPHLALVILRGMEAQTLFEKADATLSGSRIGVRAARFTVGGKPRGGVVLTLRVPGALAQTLPDGSVASSLTLNPDEGLGIAEWLREAFRAADPVGPALYDDV